MSHDDFAFEPVRGLPAKLPQGETLLWQGEPRWKALAIRAYHVRKVAAYFLILVLVRIGFGINDGHTLGAVALSCAWIASLGGVAVGVLSFLAYLASRMTVYSITSERILIRHGVAVPMTINIPLSLIQAADLQLFGNNGDIHVGLPKEHRVGYLVTWPNVRAGYYAHPQPSFRALADAKHAATLLGQTLAAHAGISPLRVGAGQSIRNISTVDPRTAATA